MKILYHRGKPGDDYMYDMLLHGLRNISGIEVVDDPYIEQMYSSTFGPGKKDIKTISAKGFSVYGLLPDTSVDRDDIDNKVRTGYYDLIICDVFHGHRSDVILQHADKNKIVFIDGEDSSNIAGMLASRFRYFKRELRMPLDNILPISFAIPKEKIRQRIEKTRPVAHIDPRDRSTYIYDDEDSYYKGYNESLFGVTMCKSGWDCLRHYEILAARCVPWFIDLDGCPELTCTTLPKQELKRVNEMIRTYGAEAMMTGVHRNEYDDLRNTIDDMALRDCTTEAMARYVLEFSV